jgi:hypothetical protein
VEAPNPEPRAPSPDAVLIGVAVCHRCRWGWERRKI